jgi:hypothetical protein
MMTTPCRFVSPSGIIAAKPLDGCDGEATVKEIREAVGVTVYFAIPARNCGFPIDFGYLLERAVGATTVDSKDIDLSRRTFYRFDGGGLAFFRFLKRTPGPPSFSLMN